jgi:hypothetical protein
MKSIVLQLFCATAIVVFTDPLLAGEMGAPAGREHLSRVPGGQVVSSSYSTADTIDRTVTASDLASPSANAEVMSATTTTGNGLVINPTFDTSITSNPNAAAIEAMINRAIAIYESLFSDSVTVSILFRYSTTRPNGTAIGDPNLIALSNYTIYSPSWSTYINALQADAKTSET